MEKSIEKIFGISIGHITEEDKEMLEAEARTPWEKASFSVGEFEYGFFLFTPLDPDVLGQLPKSKDLGLVKAYHL